MFRKRLVNVLTVLALGIVVFEWIFVYERWRDAVTFRWEFDGVINYGDHYGHSLTKWIAETVTIRDCLTFAAMQLIPLLFVATLGYLMGVRFKIWHREKDIGDH
ncbi:hypothetical protein L1D34_29710 [Vibrio mediterranei]|jgi:hypothetical protein|uniref:hypothetical protein n=1 Tax=Vibrio mediterranei TaxID=689 RepID=UPI001EFE04A6|nr:hypothetical protein [Vibrio mediterranei]MCG9628984.1 hypothetical protein [Vibrio mediterranei]MCY9855379.1 hypothetical protein [Vibrio mediterranei]